MDAARPAEPASRNTMSAMACSPIVRLAATVAAALCAVLPAVAGSTTAQAAQAAQTESNSAPLSVTVTSVTPSFLQQGHTVTISGLVRNRSGAAASGLSIRLLSSSTPFGSRTNLRNFAAGSYAPLQTPVNVSSPTRKYLGAKKTWRWKIKLPASSLPASCFGVYPLTVQFGDAALQTASDPVPLPYWPTKPASCQGQRRPSPSPISWIWPLMDLPHQDVCAGLIDNGLAASIAPHGRLGYLSAIGARYATKAALTWAIDPALLDSVHAMKQRYRVGTTPRCRGRSPHPASPYAASWLRGLRRATAGHTVFVTPYADVNVAALVGQVGLANTGDFSRSVALGDQAAHRILGRAVGPAALPAGRNRLSGIAWPPGGTASTALLTAFSLNHFSTVVLAPRASPVSYTPAAVTSTLTQTGKMLHILLADRPITAELGSGLASSSAPGARLRVSQLYLAETAMIAAEKPGSLRPIVVAPPRRWNPTRSLAGALLGETVHAPWLKPSTPGQLVAMKPEHANLRLTHPGLVSEHTTRLLASVSRLDKKIALLRSMSITPIPDLYRTVAGIESSAWHGKAAKQARAILTRAWRDVDSQLRGVSIRGGGARGTYHVTFGGSTAPVNVFIDNGLNYPVTVGLRVHATRAKVAGVPRSITIGAHSISSPVKLTVHVQANHASIRLRLVTPRGTLRHGQVLPAAPLVILIHPTAFGIVALMIVAVALAVFVIASAFRAIRSGRPPEPEDLDDTAASPPPPELPGAGQPAETSQTTSATLAADAGVRDQIQAAAAVAGLVDDTIPDWGRAMTRQSGLPDLGNRGDHGGSVGVDRPEPMTSGQAVPDPDPASPRRRANQERR